MTPFLEIVEIPTMWARIPGASFGIIQNNGLGTAGQQHDHRSSCKFDFHGRTCLKVEHACLSTCSEFIFLRPNLVKKVGTRIYTKVHEIFERPPMGPQRAPGAKS